MIHIHDAQIFSSRRHSEIKAHRLLVLEDNREAMEMAEAWTSGLFLRSV